MSAANAHAFIVAAGLRGGGYASLGKESLFSMPEATPEAHDPQCARQTRMRLSLLPVCAAGFMRRRAKNRYFRCPKRRPKRIESQ